MEACSADVASGSGAAAAPGAATREAAASAARQQAEGLITAARSVQLDDTVSRAIESRLQWQQALAQQGDAPAGEGDAPEPDAMPHVVAFLKERGLSVSVASTARTGRREPSLFETVSAAMYGTPAKAAQLRQMAAAQVAGYAARYWGADVGAPAADPRLFALDAWRRPYTTLAAYLAALRDADAHAPGDLLALRALADALCLNVRLLQRDAASGRMVYTQWPQSEQAAGGRSVTAVVYLALGSARSQPLQFLHIKVASPAAVAAAAVAAAAAAPGRAAAGPAAPRRGFRLRAADDRLVDVELVRFGADGREEANTVLGLIRIRPAGDARVAVYELGMATGEERYLGTRDVVELDAPSGDATDAVTAGGDEEDDGASGGGEYLCPPCELSDAAAWGRYLRGVKSKGVGTLLRALSSLISELHEDANLDCADADADDSALGTFLRVVERTSAAQEDVVKRATLAKQNGVMIVGGEGAGKSFTANRIAHQLMVPDAEQCRDAPVGGRRTERVRRSVAPGPEHDTLFSTSAPSLSEAEIKERIDKGFEPNDMDGAADYDIAAVVPSGRGTAVTSVPNHLHFRRKAPGAAAVNRVELHLNSLREVGHCFVMARLALAGSLQAEGEEEGGDAAQPSLLEKTPRFWCEKALAIVGHKPSEVVSPVEQLRALLEEQPGALVLPARMRAKMDASPDGAGSVWEFNLFCSTGKEVRDAVRDIMMRETIGEWSSRGLIKETHTYLSATDDLDVCELPGFGDLHTDHFRQHVLRMALKQPFATLLLCIPGHDPEDRGVAGNVSAGLAASGIIKRYVEELHTHGASFNVVTLLPLDRYMFGLKGSNPPAEDVHRILQMLPTNPRSPLQHTRRGLYFKTQVLALVDDMALQAAAKRRLIAAVQSAEAAHLSTVAVNVSGELQHAPEERYGVQSLVTKLLQQQDAHAERVRINAICSLSSRCFVPLFDTLASQLVSFDAARRDAVLARRADVAVDKLRCSLEVTFGALVLFVPPPEQPLRSEAGWRDALSVLPTTKARATEEAINGRLDACADYNAGRRELREELLSSTPQDTPVTQLLLEEFNGAMLPARIELRQLLIDTLKVVADAVLAPINAWKTETLEADGGATLQQYVGGAHATLTGRVQDKLKEVLRSAVSGLDRLERAVLEQDVPAVLMPLYKRVLEQRKLSNDRRKKMLTTLVVSEAWDMLMARFVAHARKLAEHARKDLAAALQAECLAVINACRLGTQANQLGELHKLQVFDAADAAAVKLAQMISGLREAAGALGLQPDDIAGHACLDAKTAGYASMIAARVAAEEAALAQEAAGLTAGPDFDPPPREAGPTADTWSCPNCGVGQLEATSTGTIVVADGAPPVKHCGCCSNYFRKRQRMRPQHYELTRTRCMLERIAKRFKAEKERQRKRKRPVAQNPRYSLRGASAAHAAALAEAAAPEGDDRAAPRARAD